jgi:hypothetical protein
MVATTTDCRAALRFARNDRGIEKVCGDWDADETDLLRKDTDKNGFFL